MRAEKESIVNEMRARVGEASFVFLADHRGLKVEQFNELRRRLEKTGARLLVVKNRLFRHVAAERSWTGLTPSLRGPSAVISGRDVVETAKALQHFCGEHRGLPVVKSGVMGTQLLSGQDVAALAALPPRPVLLATMLGTLAAPLGRLSGVMKQKLASVVYVLKAVEGKKNSAA